ncbi:OmpP1/FadL family transporter [Xanthomonas albilineans]|uniref:Probable long-chain fatty acid outer membrane transporter, fadl protein n=1 Tax=Xanthomonas albilineans (strain GPE PC73 / CFBP 7063) TaxID=380358 RepID=D2UBE3_XANAP|nr:outer membrane protein transport protein [Xanthomonas albilineans]QHQ27134.1 putative long-chain fatty acid outer membrane transporter fadl protein [Xanthomonas albilineans]CBA14932.1 probable long-chain fatty acid outer membrane transporter, fadl protein [Xanthomonas albilineans GPE PC73]
MQNATQFVRFTALAVGIVGALTMGQAHGAAFQLKENSAKGLGRAFAGAGSAPDDASIIAVNPAGMRQLDGSVFQADVSAIQFSAKYRGNGGTYANGAPISGGNGGDAGMIAPVPAFYLHMPFGADNNMHFGTSLTVPFGFKTQYDRDWVGRYNGVKTELQTIDLNAAFSYDVNPYVSFGASVFAERLNIDLTNAIDFGTILASRRVPGFTPGSVDGFSRLKGDNTAAGFTLGGLFSVDENTHIGFSYRSQVKHKITDGDVDFTVWGNVATVLAVAAPGTFVDTKGRATVKLPASATASFTHNVNEQWTVMADVTRTAWKKFDKITVDFASNQPENTLLFSYRDTTSVALGTEYRMSDTLTLRGGVAYDQTPTTDQHRDVRVPDQSRKWASLGLTWKPSQQVEYSVGYTHLFINDPRVATTSATGNTLVGHYDLNGNVLAGSVNYKF